jgi:hypothetical protein
VSARRRKRVEDPREREANPSSKLRVFGEHGDARLGVAQIAPSDPSPAGLRAPTA